MIRLQFSAEAGIGAEAIKLYQRGWCSHVDALLPWFCSELIARALEVSGFFPKNLSVGVNEVTPRDLLMTVSPWRQA